MIPRIGMSLVIQEAPTTGNWVRWVPIHIYIPEALLSFAEGGGPRSRKELRCLLLNQVEWECQEALTMQTHIHQMRGQQL
jgi:hypothetical protein